MRKQCNQCMRNRAIPCTAANCRYVMVLFTVYPPTSEMQLPGQLGQHGVWLHGDEPMLQANLGFLAWSCNKVRSIHSEHTDC